MRVKRLEGKREEEREKNGVIVKEKWKRENEKNEDIKEYREEGENSGKEEERKDNGVIEVREGEF